MSASGVTANYQLTFAGANPYTGGSIVETYNTTSTVGTNVALLCPYLEGGTSISLEVDTSNSAQTAYWSIAVIGC